MTALPVPVAPSSLSLLPRLSEAAAAAVDVSPDEVVRRWLASVSDGARRHYARALSTFSRWAMPESTDPLDGLRLLTGGSAGAAHELLVAFREHLLARLAPGTVAGQVAALSSLMRGCRRAGLIGWHVEGVAPKRERVQDRSGPRRGDVERLLARVDDEAARGDAQAVRDAALVRLLYCCAMRRAEVAGLRIEDVRLDGPDGATVSPRRKGARTRQPLAVSERTAAAIVAWLAVRGDEPGALFHRLDRAGDRSPLSGEAVRQLLRGWAKRAGVRATVRPHGLRHSAATELAKRGSLDELMSLGGWRSLSAASAYLDKGGENRRRALALVDL